MSKSINAPGGARGASRAKARVSGANARERAEAGGPANNKWRILFLQKLAETSNVSESASAAKVSPSRAYRVRRGDARFAAQWRDALLEGYDHLELELLGFLRAANPARKMDVAGALKLLSLHAQTVARARAAADNRDEQEVLDSIDAMIDEMRERAAANELEIARTAADDDDQA